MDFTEQLRILQAAQGDPAKLALATIDLTFPALGETDRSALKDTLLAAAVPHWCDAAILSALLQGSPAECGERLARLRTLNVIEPFPARGADAVNVHEAARLALRRSLATQDEFRFRTLSHRTAAFFAADSTLAGRIEWIYHRLCADPEKAATELENLDRQWIAEAYSEGRDALALALGELEAHGWVQGSARVEVLLFIAETRNARGEATKLEQTAREALELAGKSGSLVERARVHCLLGDVLQAQGKLTEALAAYGEDLRISVKLAEQDSANAGWQRDLAATRTRVASVLAAQGKLMEAEAMFEEALRINAKLVEQYPTNTDWQEDLAVAYSRLGCVLEAQGKLVEAELAYGEDLRISVKLVEHSPTNVDWQEGLAVAHGRVGSVLEAQGKLAEAEAAFGEALRIGARLAKQVPTNANWQRGLAVAYGKVGDVLETQGKLPEAEAAFTECLCISARLVEQDPTNADWQRALAVAHSRLGGVLEAQGRLAKAQVAYREDLRICGWLVKQDPANTGWQQDAAAAHRNWARLSNVLRHLQAVSVKLSRRRSMAGWLGE